MRSVALSVFSLALTSCSQASADPFAAEIAELDRVSHLCGLPRSTFKLDATGDLHFQPKPGERIEAVDCALKELKEKQIVFVPQGIIMSEVPAGAFQ